MKVYEALPYTVPDVLPEPQPALAGTDRTTARRQSTQREKRLFRSTTSCGRARKGLRQHITSEQTSRKRALRALPCWQTARKTISRKRLLHKETPTAPFHFPYEYTLPDTTRPTTSKQPADSRIHSVLTGTQCGRSVSGVSGVRGTPDMTTVRFRCVIFPARSSPCPSDIRLPEPRSPLQRSNALASVGTNIPQPKWHACRMAVSSRMWYIIRCTPGGNPLP